MRSVIVAMSIFSLSLTTQARSLEISCDVVKLLTGRVFEEGLAETGGSTDDVEAQIVKVEIDEAFQELRVGETEVRSFDGAQVTVRSTATETVVTGDDMRKEVIQLRIYKASGKGVILQKERDATRFTTVAEVDCNDYTEVKKALESGRNVTERKVTAAQVPLEIMRKINQIEVGFEMGDGYYDVKSETLYELSIRGKVAGYRLDSELTYTQGDDTTAYTYFLGNGVRFSGPAE